MLNTQVQGQEPHRQVGLVGLCRQSFHHWRHVHGLPCQNLRKYQHLHHHGLHQSCLTFHEQVKLKIFKYVWFKFFFRIIPTIVVIYRVVMVCHVDIGYKYGERRIRDMLLR